MCNIISLGSHNLRLRDYLSPLSVDDVKRMINRVLCHGCLHDISVVVGQSLSENPALSCAPCSMEVMDFFEQRYTKVSADFWESPFYLLFHVIAAGVAKLPKFSQVIRPTCDV